MVHPSAESMHLPSVHSWRSRTSNDLYSSIKKSSNSATPGVSLINLFLLFCGLFFFFSSCKYICFLREAGVIPYSRKGLKFLFIWLSKNGVSVDVQATFGAVRMAPTTWP